MSKGNMLLGHARGKVGDLVFSRSNGQQVVRSRAAVVKNPQTESQMIQRIILNTIAQAYSRLRPICDHSFEGVQQGQQSMSAFMRKNLKQIRAKVSDAVAANWDLYSIYAFTPVGQNLFMPNDFVLSSGSLPNVGEVTFPTSTKAAVILGGDTYGDIIEANNLQRGDQLTFLIVKGTTASAATMHYARIILDPTNADGSQAPLSSPLITNGAVNLPSLRNTGSFDEISFADNVLTFNMGAVGQIAQCAAVIVSRKGTDGNWMRSNTSFTLNTDGVAGLLFSLGEALDIFNAGGFDSQNELYLNNAGNGPLVSKAAAPTFEIRQVYVANASADEITVPVGGSVSAGLEYNTFFVRFTSALTSQTTMAVFNVATGAEVGRASSDSGNRLQVAGSAESVVAGTYEIRLNKGATISATTGTVVGTITFA